VKRNGGDTRTMGLYGQELINITAAIARMNLVLHGVLDFDIRSGNTLHEPALIDGDRLRTFDVVLANPPYSIKNWNRDAWQSDQWGRNFLGTPPQGRADYAFFQHILRSMDPVTGRCAVLFPHGVLFRKDEAALRRRLVETDMVECVLGLGPNLFYNSPMEACVVICRSQKSEGTRGKTLFIDASSEVARTGAQSFLSDANRTRILRMYNAFASEPGFAEVVETAALLAGGANLTIHHYVSRTRGSAGLEKGPMDDLRVALDAEGARFWPAMESAVAAFDEAAGAAHG
jgi:type I restriction enzyme M protein